MKKWILLVVCFACLTCGSSAFASFTPSEWAQEEYLKARGQGIVPQAFLFSEAAVPTTREEFCALAVLAYEAQSGRSFTPQASMPFTDTKSEEVHAAYELGLVSGVSETAFEPSRAMTRQEAAVLLCNVAQLFYGETTASDYSRIEQFADYADIADWAKPYIAAMVLRGALLGNADGTFAPQSLLTHEQAIILLSRLTAAPAETVPQLTAPADKIRFSAGGALTVSWSGTRGKPTEVVLIDVLTGKQTVAAKSENGTARIASSQLDSKKVYDVLVRQGSVLSDPVRITGSDLQFALSYRLSDGDVQLHWTQMPGVETYTVTISQTRDSRHPGDIPPKDDMLFILSGDSLTWTVDPMQIYQITVSAGELSDSVTFRTGRAKSVEESRAELFPDGYFTSEEDADAHMKTITVPVWRLAGGTKKAGTASLTVHEGIADIVAEIFQEIFDGPEQFPIKDVGGYAWRASSSQVSLSEHNLGTAIDINYDENYCIYGDGTIVGKYWKPYEDPYSITPYGDVIRAFERYGFTWGGDAWNSTKDFMHFSYLGT